MCMQKSTEKMLRPVFLDTSANKVLMGKLKKDHDRDVQEYRKLLRAERRKRKENDDRLTRFKAQIKRYLEALGEIPHQVTVSRRDSNSSSIITTPIDLDVSHSEHELEIVGENAPTSSAGGSTVAAALVTSIDDGDDRSNGSDGDDGDVHVSFLQSLYQSLGDIRVDPSIVATSVSDISAQPDFGSDRQFNVMKRFLLTGATHMRFIGGPEHMLVDDVSSSTKMQQIRLISTLRSSVIGTFPLGKEYGTVVSDLQTFYNSNEHCGLVASSDKCVRLLDINSKKLEACFQCDEIPTCLTYSASNVIDTIYVGLMDGSVIALDRRNMSQPLHRLQMPHVGMIDSMRICPTRPESIFICHGPNGLWNSEIHKQNHVSMGDPKRVNSSIGGNAGYCFLAGHDPCSQLYYTSFGNTETTRRKIDHHIFTIDRQSPSSGNREDSNNVEIILKHTVSEKPVSVHDADRPTMLETILNSKPIKSPSTIFSFSSAVVTTIDLDSDSDNDGNTLEINNVNNDGDDDVRSFDTTLLAYARRRRLHLVEPITGKMFQELRLDHFVQNSITSIDATVQDHGTFLATCSSDRIVMLRYGM